MASGMKEAFQKAAVAVFNAAGDIKETVTFRSKQNLNPTYVPGTDTITDAYINHQNIEMIFMGYKTQEIDGNTVLATDVKAMCLVENLPIMPHLNDIIIRTEENNDGSTSEIQWDVVNAQKDAADAVWTFQIRRP